MHKINEISHPADYRTLNYAKLIMEQTWQGQMEIVFVGVHLGKRIIISHTHTWLGIC